MRTQTWDNCKFALNRRRRTNMAQINTTHTAVFNHHKPVASRASFTHLQFTSRDHSLIAQARRTIDAVANDEYLLNKHNQSMTCHDVMRSSRQNNPETGQFCHSAHACPWTSRRRASSGRTRYHLAPTPARPRSEVDKRPHTDTCNNVTS